MQFHDIQDSGNRGQGQRRKGRSSSPASHSKARKALWTRVKFHADSNSVKNCHVSSGILPCVKITSLTKMHIWRRMPYPTW